MDGLGEGSWSQMFYRHTQTKQANDDDDDDAGSREIRDTDKGVESDSSDMRLSSAQRGLALLFILFLTFALS